MVEAFHGNLELPEDGSRSTGEIHIQGWVFSLAGNVVRIQVFLEGEQIGALTCGFKRPDVLAAFPSSARLACGFSERVQAPRPVTAGDRELRVEVHDDRGNRHSYSRVLHFLAPEFFRPAVFYEELQPGVPSLFDEQKDAAERANALTVRRLDGFCNVAATHTSFEISPGAFRENALSAISQSISRHRQVVCGLSLGLFGNPSVSLPEIAAHVNEVKAKIYLAESQSALERYLKQHLDPGLIICSEYFGPNYKSGELVNGTLHEDLQRTSFEDETFDIIITSEVMEHVPDAPAAEKEVTRLLKKGGVYCFTAPFGPTLDDDIILADQDEHGTIRYYAPPQFHGDPLRPDEGILAYRVFSFNGLRRRFTGLGTEIKAYRFWSRDLVILGNENWVLVVQK